MQAVQNLFVLLLFHFFLFNLFHLHRLSVTAGGTILKSSETVRYWFDPTRAIGEPEQWHIHSFVLNMDILIDLIG